MEEIFGLLQYTPEQWQNIKETERRANDRIRVFNPTLQDFTTGWDGVAFTVPNRNKDTGYGKGQRVVPRYIAINFLLHMTSMIINSRINAATKAENDRRRSSGQLPMTKYDEQHTFETGLMLNSRDEKKKIWRALWLGVEEEWGFNNEGPVQEIQSEEDRAFALEMERPAQRLNDSDLPTLDWTAPNAVDTQPINDPMLTHVRPASVSVQGVPDLNNPAPQPAQAPVNMVNPEAQAANGGTSAAVGFGSGMQGTDGGITVAPPDPKDQILKDVAQPPVL